MFILFFLVITKIAYANNINIQHDIVYNKYYISESKPYKNAQHNNINDLLLIQQLSINGSMDDDQIKLCLLLNSAFNFGSILNVNPGFSLANRYGKISFGKVKDALSFLRSDALSLLRISRFGIPYYLYDNINFIDISDIFLNSDYESRVNYLNKIMDDNIKITYISPLIDNFRLGLSFATKSDIQLVLQYIKKLPQNILFKGFIANNYKNNINKLLNPNIFSYINGAETGFHLKYLGLTIAASYGFNMHIDNSYHSNNKLSSYYYTYGAHYQILSFKAGIARISALAKSNNLSQKNFESTIMKLDYRVKKNINYYIQGSYDLEEEKNFYLLKKDNLKIFSLKGGVNIRY